MRLRWVVLAALNCLTVGVAVWLCLPRPLWQQVAQAGDGKVLGFSPNGHVVYTAHRTKPDKTTGPVTAPDLCHWDAATGALIRTVPIPLGEPTVHPVQLLLSPTADTVVSACVDRSRRYGPVSVCFIHDVQTGRQIAGPIRDVVNIGLHVFSPDGRWLCVHHGSQGRSHDGMDVISLATGETVLPIRSGAFEPLQHCCFASDGNAVATQWGSGSDKEPHTSIRIFDLPGGRERRRIDLPPRGCWEGPVRFVDNYLDIESWEFEHVPFPAKYQRRIFSFDLAAEPPHDGIEGPLMIGHSNELGQSSWDEGPNWLAHLHWSLIQKKKWERWLEEAAQRVAVNFKAKEGVRVKVQFLEPSSGQVRHEHPASFPFPCSISRDGTRIACVEAAGRVQVWAADPAPRWPWAVAAGMIAAGTWVLLGRRYREKS